MIGTITPLVKVARKEWFSVSAAFVLGSIVASAVFGAALGAVGAEVQRVGRQVLSADVRTGILLAVVGLGIARELVWPQLRFPEHRRSVPRRWWLHYDHRFAALAYGAVLGIGVTTHARFVSLHAMIGWILLFGAPLSGGIVMVTYGTIRALTVIAPSWSAVREEAPGEVVCRIRDRLLAETRVLRVANGMSLAVLLIALAGNLRTVY